MRRITRSYDPQQLRDSDGKWVNVPFDTAGLIDAFDINGTFGDAMLGLDHSGDVRFAFRELRGGRNHNREFDVDLADVEQLRDSLNELVEFRDGLLADGEDLDPRGLYDDRAWGFNDENLIELYGNGQIVVTIGHADDPWQLRLDPPYEADPDDPDDEDTDDTQAFLDSIDELWEAADTEGFLEDVPEGDAVGRASIERKFNPNQLRGPNGQWLGGDNLNLSGRVELADGERLIASDQLDPAESGGEDSFADVMFAVVETPRGREARIGVIPHDDKSKWRAGNRGATAQLDHLGVERLRSELAVANAKAKKDAAAADKIWADGGNGNDYSDSVASGTVASPWGDITYSVSLTDDEPTSWKTSINVGTDGDGTVLDPKDGRKLLQKLGALAAELDPDVERARSPENGAAAPAGGQFAVGGGRVGGGGKKPGRRRPRAKPAVPAGPLSFDGKSGSGYGIKGGDPRVRTLQAALTRLGVTDSAGKELAPDGKYGPKTTSAVKKLQSALGLKADGQVTPELLKQVTDLKQLPPTAKPRTPRKRSKSTRRSLLSAVNRALRLGVEVRHQQLFDRTYILDDIQIQRSGDGRTVEAYAAMFNAPYEVRDQHGHYMEVIDRSAFNRTLSNGAGRNALCLYNHGMSVVDGKPDPMAQIPIGTPLEIRADDRGLLTVTRYNKGDYADRLLEAIRNGAIRSQSFRGRIMRSSPERVPLRSRTGALPTITRHELGLTDYGPTPIPVNAGAEIMAVRSLNELAQDFAALDDDGRLELLRTLGVDLDGVDDEGNTSESNQDEEITAPTAGDDTPTSTEEVVELGAEDPPVMALRSASHLTRRIRAAMILRGID